MLQTVIDNGGRQIILQQQFLLANRIGTRIYIPRCGQGNFRLTEIRLILIKKIAALLRDMTEIITLRPYSGGMKP